MNEDEKPSKASIHRVFHNSKSKPACQILNLLSDGGPYFFGYGLPDGSGTMLTDMNPEELIPTMEKCLEEIKRAAEQGEY